MNVDTTSSIQRRHYQTDNEHGIKYSIAHAYVSFNFFTTVRKLKIFGFRIDGIPEQLNFLFDENKTIGKDVTMTHCLNSVLPMIDWTMQIHGAD